MKFNPQFQRNLHDKMFYYSNVVWLIDGIFLVMVYVSGKILRPVQIKGMSVTVWKK